MIRPRTSRRLGALALALLLAVILWLGTVVVRGEELLLGASGARMAPAPATSSRIRSAGRMAGPAAGWAAEGPSKDSAPKIIVLLLWLENGEVAVQPASEAECRSALAELAAAGGGTFDATSGRHEIVQADCVEVGNAIVGEAP